MNRQHALVTLVAAAVLCAAAVAGTWMINGRCCGETHPAALVGAAPITWPLLPFVLSS